MKKRILALLMAAAMMFALAACGNQSNDTSRRGHRANQDRYAEDRPAGTSNRLVCRSGHT